MVYVEWPLRAMCTFGGFNCAQGHMVDVAYGSCALCTWWFLPEGALVECHPGSKRFSKSSHVLAILGYYQMLPFHFGCGYFSLNFEN